MNDWYKITATANRKAVIQVYGYIGDSWDSESVTAKNFFKEVSDLAVDAIELRINSPGGSVFDGYAIYNLLKEHKASVHVKIDGLAASIASVIAMAGDTIEMPENAMMMIHDPSGIVIGTASDMRKMAEALDKIKAGIMASYRSKTGMNDEKLGRLMSDETWFTAKEAVLLGFSDKMTGEEKVENAFNEKAAGAFARFKNVPAQVLNVVSISNHSNKHKKENEKMEITAEFLKKDHPQIVAALISEAITGAFLKEKHADVVEALVKGAREEAATAERDRIQAVLASSMPGHEGLVNTLAFDGETTAEQAAVQILAAEKKVRENVKGKIEADSIKPMNHAEPPANDGDQAADDKDLPLEERAKAKWDTDGKLRGEFGNDYDAFFSYFKAVENGQVRVLKSK